MIRIATKTRKGLPMNLIRMLSPSHMLKNVGKKVIWLANACYLISLIAGVLSGIVLFILMLERLVDEGDWSILLIPIFCIAAGLLGGLAVAIPLKGFGVIVSWFENAGPVMEKPAEASAPRAGQPEEKRPVIREEEPRKMPGPVWRCSCGERNPESVGVCRVCGAGKPARRAGAEKKSDAQPIGKVHTENGMWICSCGAKNAANRISCRICNLWPCSCGAFNPGSRGVCMKCGAEKPYIR